MSASGNGPGALTIVPIVGALTALGLLVVLWMVFVERRRFRVRRVVLDADALGMPALRMLHLTDAHFHGRDEPILRFLERLSAAEQFDLVLLTGDMIDGPGGLASTERALSLFRPSIGTVAVLGGHDYARPGTVAAYVRLLRKGPLEPGGIPNPGDELCQRLERAGVTMLRDSSAVLETPEGRLAVVGLEDAFVCEVDFDAAWRGVPAGTPAVVIAHSPDVVRQVAERGAPLAFFGHTHGGQIRFPFVGAVVTRSRLPRRLAAGVFRLGATVFVINHGLGTSPATPYRLFCPPEATVLELAHGPRETTPVEEVELG